MGQCFYSILSRQALEHEGRRASSRRSGTAGSSTASSSRWQVALRHRGLKRGGGTSSNRMWHAIVQPQGAPRVRTCWLERPECPSSTAVSAEPAWRSSCKETKTQSSKRGCGRAGSREMLQRQSATAGGSRLPAARDTGLSRECDIPSSSSTSSSSSSSSSSRAGGEVLAGAGAKFPRQLSQEGETGAEAAQRAALKRKTEEPRGTKRLSETAGHEPDDESRTQEERVAQAGPGEGSAGEGFAVPGEHLDSDVPLAPPTAP